MRVVCKATKLLLIAAASICVRLPSSFAADLTIQDTSGFSRAAAEVDGPGSVEFSVVTEGGALAEGVPVTLSNAATGQILTATASNGIVTFQGVTPGVWTVATTAPGVTFTNVAIASAIAAGGVGATGALVPALAIGGAGAGAAVAVSNDDNNDEEISPAS